MLQNYKRYPIHLKVLTALVETTDIFNRLYGNKKTEIYLVGGCIYGELWELPIGDIDLKYKSGRCPFKDKDYMDILIRNTNTISIHPKKDRTTRTGIKIVSIIINNIEVESSVLDTTFAEYVLNNMSFATADIINITTGVNENPYSEKTQRDIENKTLSIPSYSCIENNPARIGRLLAMMALYGLKPGDGFPFPADIYKQCNNKMMQHIMYIGLDRISKQHLSDPNMYETVKKYTDLLFQVGWWSSFTDELKIECDFPPYEDIKKEHRTCKSMFAIASIKRFGFGFADALYLFKSSKKFKRLEIFYNDVKDKRMLELYKRTGKTKFNKLYYMILFYMIIYISDNIVKYTDIYEKKGRFHCETVMFKYLMNNWPNSIEFINCFIENYEYAKTKFNRIIYLNITNDITVFI
jgi:hypothetical protein